LVTIFFSSDNDDVVNGDRDVCFILIGEFFGDEFCFIVLFELLLFNNIGKNDFLLTTSFSIGFSLFLFSKIIVLFFQILKNYFTETLFHLKN
jgi:hypothetical protein